MGEPGLRIKVDMPVLVQGLDSIAGALMFSRSPCLSTIVESFGLTYSPLNSERLQNASVHVNCCVGQGPRGRVVAHVLCRVVAVREREPLTLEPKP